MRRRVALRRRGLACALGCAAGLAGAMAIAQVPDAGFTQAQITKGAGIYERNCAPCHGPRMADPQGASNLRAFPREEKAGFVVMVTKGKNNMPPWGDVLRPDDIDALWAYVIAGER